MYSETCIRWLGPDQVAVLQRWLIEFASKLVIKMQYMMKQYKEVAISVASEQCIH